MTRKFTNFATAIDEVERDMVEMGYLIQTEKWQGIQTRPDMKMFEMLMYGFQVNTKGELDLQVYRDQIKPNLPWADDHFLERVCGEPLNPGVEWANWPWGKSANKFRTAGQQFNHNYMERYWPKHAGMTPDGSLEKVNEAGMITEYADNIDTLKGIRHSYGDLNDLVQLLVNEPLTRQAWLPIFFPEDTGVGDGGRKPCTLGYQFMVRDKKLHIYYPLRSCDLIRHFRDDIYLTIRLALWIIRECSKRSEYWMDVVPGIYQMHCTSLHMFEGDMPALKKKHNGDVKKEVTYNFAGML